MRRGYYLVAVCLLPTTIAYCSNGDDSDETFPEDAATLTDGAPLSDTSLPEDSDDVDGGDSDDASPTFVVDSGLDAPYFADECDGGPTTIRWMTPWSTSLDGGGVPRSFSGSVVFRVRALCVGSQGLDFVVDGAKVAQFSRVAEGSYRVEVDTSAIADGDHTFLAQSARMPSVSEGVVLTVVNARTRAMPVFPKGLIYTNGFDGTTPPPGFFTAHPWVGAFGLFVGWSGLEATWSSPLRVNALKKIDDALAYAATVQRPVVLILKSGGDVAPAWVTGDPLFRPTIFADSPTSAGEQTLVPWDPVVRDYWANTASELAAKYDNHPWLAGVYVAGVNAEYPEMIFHHPSNDAGQNDPSAWSNAADVPPKGIRATFDDNNAPFSPSGAEYASAWLDQIRRLRSQWKRSWQINMVDELFYPHDSGAWLGPMMSVASAVESSYSGAATLGTANLGNVASLKTQKFVLLDDDSTSMTHGAPRYYEIGPKQIPPYDAAADGGPASYPYPMAAAVRRCKPGAAGLGCTAAMVFGSSWNANDASATKLAVCETWPSSTGCP